MSTTGLSNGRLGMMLLVGTETLVFSSFIGAYIVLRAAAAHWPPFGAPALPVDLSIFNTLLLLVSAGLVFRQQIVATFASGVVFLLLQAVEFHRLYAQGLTLKTGTYGALFYTLISCHGLHVVGGLGILAVAFRKRTWGEYAAMYWYFVTGVWLVLFGILYLI